MRRIVPSPRCDDGDAVTFRCGFAEISDGAIVKWRKRWFPKHASLSEVLFRRWFRGGTSKVCRIYWHIPFLRPGVLCVDYIHTGPRCHWRDITAAANAIDEVARERGCLIAVCHVTNDRLTDRVLNRLGYERHCLNWSGRHFIKRYEPMLHRSTWSADPSHHLRACES